MCLLWLRVSLVILTFPTHPSLRTQPELTWPATGAGVTLAVVAGVLGALWLLGMAAFGKRGMRQSAKNARHENYSLPAYEHK